MNPRSSVSKAKSKGLEFCPASQQKAQGQSLNTPTLLPHDICKCTETTKKCFAQQVHLQASCTSPNSAQQGSTQFKYTYSIDTLAHTYTHISVCQKGRTEGSYTTTTPTTISALYIQTHLSTTDYMCRPKFTDFIQQLVKIIQPFGV